MVRRDRPSLSCRATGRMVRKNHQFKFLSLVKEVIMPAQKLLSRSGFLRSGLPDWGVEIRLHEMDYPFLYVHFFPFGKNSVYAGYDFPQQIHRLAEEYMTAWTLRRTDDLEKNFRASFNFQGSIFLEEAFAQIVDGNDTPVDVILPVSNARLRMKRFGNCLGMRFLSNNPHNSSEIHVDGTKLMREFCQNSTLPVREFIHSIECIIPLPRKQDENNSVTIDFAYVYGELERACPYFILVSLGRFIRTLISNYKEKSDSEIIGVFQEEKVCARLIHYQEMPEQRTLQWKKGNVEPTIIPVNKYRFLDGKDLCLSLKIESPFPESTFMKPFDVDMDVVSQQKELLLAGATLYSQLCAMIANGLFKS
jgi:hypothetical protein